MAMVLLWSCQEKNGPESVASGSIALAGSVTDGQIIVGPEGGDFSVNVTSSDAWRVSGFSDWVTVSSEAGKNGQPLTFSVLPNEDAKSRTVTFKVFCADAVEAVTITQTPTYTVALMSEDIVNVNSNANLVSVNLITNIEELEIDFGGAEDWIQLSDVADAFGKKIVQFDVNRSREFKERTAVLTIGGADVNDAVTVTVNQAQRDTAFFVYDEQKYVQGLEALSVSFVLKSNVDVTYSVPSWLNQTVGEVSEKDESGLQSQTVTFTADACGGSRTANLSFKAGGVTVGTFMVKQQNPNPVFTEIPDENLRYLLESSGWIIPDYGIRCEIVEAGVSGTSLVIGLTNPDNYGADPINSIEGLENFPNLESLTLGNLTISKVDVSSFPKLNELRLINCNSIEEVNTGNRPITSLKNEFGTYTYTSVQHIVIKGENLENVDFSVVDNYYVDYEQYLESFDVTGCPKLKTLNVYRENSWGPSSLKYIYMTADQVNTVSVTKRDAVEIVVK